MDALRFWLDRANALVWSGPSVVLLLTTGAYLSFVLRGVQLRRLGRALRVALVERDEPEAEGDISHFQALMLALGGSIGVGNVVGVAAALAAGGPGALLWLWVAGWLAMATRYAEGVLGVHYRETDRRGRMAGGPMYYLSRGVGGWFGRFLATTFALFGVLAALGIGSAVPGHVAAGVLRSSLSVPPSVTTLALGIAGAMAVAGGVRVIGRTVAVLVPVMVAVYLLIGLGVIAVNWRQIDDVVLAVANGAVTAGAVSGGAVGAAVREAVRWGVGQGVLSAGTGLGTGAMAAAAARTRTATTHALVAMTQTFIDTVVVSAVTGLALLVSGAHRAFDATMATAYTGVPLAAAASPTGLPGEFGGAILMVGLVFFAFTTILAWAYYGERSAEYLFGEGATTVFRACFVAAVFAGGLLLQLGWSAGFTLVWGVSGVAGGAMMVPNLVGLLLLSGVVVRETRRSPGTR